MYDYACVSASLCNYCVSRRFVKGGEKKAVFGSREKSRVFGRFGEGRFFLFLFFYVFLLFIGSVFFSFEIFFQYWIYSSSFQESSFFFKMFFSSLLFVLFVAVIAVGDFVNINTYIKNYTKSKSEQHYKENTRFLKRIQNTNFKSLMNKTNILL